MSDPGSYIDRNGNTINATDTLGRTIGSPPLNSIPGDYGFSLPGVGVGGTLNYTLKWRYLADVLTTSQSLAYVADNGCPPGTGSFFSPQLFSSDIPGRVCIQNAMQLFNPVVLSQIVLPTGQSYTFTYNTYGEIDKVTLPTGGYEKYLYGGVTPLSYGSSVYMQYNRGVASRTVSSTGSSADEVSWTYSGGGGYVNMVAPDGSRTERYAWEDGNSMWGYGADGARAGRAYDERVYSPSNQMLRRKLTEWAMTGSNGTANPGGSQVSNPYRVSSPGASVPATCSVCATSAYDALGRVISVTTPDSAQVTSSYAASTSGSILGTTVLVTDQAGKKRRSLTDALGRLVRVDEPDANGELGDLSNPVQPTSYAYDILGNLGTVTNARKSDLAAMHVTQANLDEFNEALQTFKETKEKPRATASERVVQTQSLPNLIHDASNILRDQIDRLVNLFRRSNSEFVAGYRSARVIIDRGASHAASQTAGSPTKTNP